MPQRGKKYIDATRRFDRARIHTPVEAIDLIKSLSKRNFDETIEAAFRLGVDPRKADQMIRGTVTAVSGDSISVKAEDGFAATFAVTAETEVHTGLPTRPAEGTQPTPPTAGAIGDVAVGDVAMVSGTGEGSAVTADHIHAMTAAEAAQFEQDRADREAEHTAQSQVS